MRKRTKRIFEEQRALLGRVCTRCSFVLKDKDLGNLVSLVGNQARHHKCPTRPKK